MLCNHAYYPVYFLGKILLHFKIGFCLGESIICLLDLKNEIIPDPVIVVFGYRKIHFRLLHSIKQFAAAEGIRLDHAELERREFRRVVAFARGEFELGSNSAMSVLQTALVVRDGFNYVFRVGADKRVAQVKVQTGRLLGDQVEILSGIKPEDKLVATGGGFLSDGDLVRVVEAAAPAAKPASK